MTAPKRAASAPTVDPTTGEVTDTAGETKVIPDASPNLAHRMLEMMRALRYLQKTGKTDSGPRFTYVKHDDVVEAVSEAAVAHGVLVLSTVDPESIRSEVIGKTSNGADIWRTTLIVRTVFTNVDNPSETAEVTAPGEGVDTSDKGTGKAMSYAIKNLLLKAFLIATGDEADNESSHIEATQPARHAPHSPAPAPPTAPADQHVAMRPAVARFWNVARDSADPEHKNKVADNTVRLWLKRNFGRISTKELTDEELAVATDWATKYTTLTRRVQAANEVLGLPAGELVEHAKQMFPSANDVRELTVAEWEQFIGWIEAKANAELDQAATADDDFPFTTTPTTGGTE